MATWNLRETHHTSFGRIAAGRAGSGPPLLLAHGWPWSSFAWHRIIPELSQSFTCHWFDMLGYGSSEMPDAGATSLDVQNALQVEMISRFEIERPIVIAHDFGGAVSLRSHLLGSADFKRLILMNVVAINPWGSEFFDHVGKHVDAFAGLPPHIHEAVVRAYIGGALARPIAAEDTEALIQPWLSTDGTRSFYKQFAQADEALTQMLEPLYAKTRCPVDILWGESDPWIPVARGRKLHDAIPGSRFERLVGVGHLPQLEQADLVLKKINALLAS